MIHVRDLRKSYGTIKAVDGVSFDIRRGEAFGLLGPNGAGKTTTLQMIVGALHPDGGTVELDGAGHTTDPKARQRIGIAPQALSLYDELTGVENLRFFGRMYGMHGSALRDAAAAALDLAGLTDRAGDLVKTYSGGMQRRLNLAVALVHKPDLLLLDEPTVGVDPHSRNHIFDRVEQLKAQGLTVLYTTHYMEEAQRLCDRVAIMDHGRILALDAVPGLIQRYGGRSVIRAELEHVPPDVSTLPAPPDGTSLRFESERPLEQIAQLSQVGLKFRTLSVQQPDLETVFLSLTGRTLRD